MSPNDKPLDALGQNPRINRLYTNLTLCFEVNDAQHSAVTDKLAQACQTLAAYFPWTAGHVICDDGVYKIRHGSQRIPLTTKTCTLDVTFTQLKEMRFPPSMFDESILAPRKTLATEHPDDADLPVFMLQANYLTGGILLTFAAQHGVLDMTGLGQLMQLFAQACRQEALTAEQLAVGNNRPLNLFSNVAQGKGTNPCEPEHESSSFETNRIESEEPAVVSTQPERNQQKIERPENLAWTCFRFSSTALATLKSKAQSAIADAGFVSTDDALSALVWLAVTRARTLTATHIPSTTTLSRNVDMRRYLSLPTNYPGLVVHATTSQQSTDSLLRQSVGQIASELRAALDARSLISDLASKVEPMLKRGNQAVQRSVPAFEVRVSSWSKEISYNLDLGFGRPMCVRRPTFLEGARDGLAYFLPKTLDASIEVAFCLTESCIAALKKDAEFLQYAICEHSS